MKEAEEVGIDMMFKLDKKLFRRYTCNGNEKHPSECQAFLQGKGYT